MAKKPRDTYKYQFKIGNKIVHGGITDDLERASTRRNGPRATSNRLAAGRRKTLRKSGKMRKATS